MLYKPEFRRPLLEERQQLSDLNIQEASKRVAAQLIYFHPLLEAKNIAYYLPSGGEIDPRLIIKLAPFQNKNYFLPALVDGKKELEFYSYTQGEALIENKFSIFEPKKEGKTAFDWKKLDIIFIPLVAFDRQCNRVGRGGGYYDRTLESHVAGLKPLLIGLAYEFQKIKDFEPNKWDIPMDLIVTENEIYERRRPLPIR